MTWASFMVGFWCGGICFVSLPLMVIVGFEILDRAMKKQLKDLL
jgi:uncharacterized protein YneF (UPF0154 family)